MAPKGRRGGAADARARDVQETEDPFQAVVLADSFETRFRPFTRDEPRCLLPLANTPLLEYILEFLARNGLEEVYLYCGAHTERVEEYIRDSQWTRAGAPFTLQTIRSTSRSIGDAMRDLDKRALLANDFLVVYGDVVSNIPIAAALAEHRARKAADKNAIMTMVLREVGDGNGGGDDPGADSPYSPVFTIDPARRRCLQYDQVQRRGGGLLLDEDALLHSGADEVEVRHDLVDCGIDICTPDVLALWSDNFDYEAPRRGFLHSVLKDYELNGKTIHVHVDRSAYGDRVRDLRAYGRVCRGVLARRAPPFCPDGVFGDVRGCRFAKGGVYREEGVHVSKSATIGRRSLIGGGTKIGARSSIEDSVVGRNCTIGERCILKGAYIWDNVTVRNGTHINQAIVAKDAVVGENCTIVDGSLISFGTNLASGTTTTRGQRITKNKPRATTASTGSGADSDSDEEEAAGLVPSLRNRSGSISSISTLSSSRSASPEPVAHGRTLSTTSNASDGTAPGAGALEASFHTEAVTSIYDSLLKGDDPANINLELQAQRLALNASEHAVRRAVVAALVAYVAHVRERQRAGGGGPATRVGEILARNGDLVRRVVFDAALAAKPDQVDLLLLAQRELAAGAAADDAATVMLSLCNGLYAEDLVQGAGLAQWWDDARGAETAAMAAVRGHPQMPQLIAIARAEDDSDDDDDDDIDEEEEEDDDEDADE